MKITESQLRGLIRSIIAETITDNRWQKDQTAWVIIGGKVQQATIDKTTADRDKKVKVRVGTGRGVIHYVPENEVYETKFYAERANR